MPTYQIPPLIRKLLPRLASSNFDGDRLATVEAIERVLGSAGLDWHDFAATIGRARDGPPSLRDMDEALADVPTFNNWEAGFVADICRLLAAGVSLSIKQEQVLRRTFARRGNPNAA